jgi:hypothetical protein
MTRPPAPGALVAAAWLAGAAPAWAQDPPRDTARAAPLAGAAATGGLILLGAAGAQTLQTPTAWPRTAGGFGRRVADQTGFYVLQTASQRALAAGLGWRDDAAPCARRGAGWRAALPLAGCAVARTFTAVDGGGARRAHVPFLASVGAATAASVLWRPERRSAATAQTFVATRLAVVFAGFAGERLLVEWRRGRGRAGATQR